MAARSKRRTPANEAKRNAAVVKRIIRRYGPVIDLRRNPAAVIDIIRRFSHEVTVEENGCGGVPPAPGPGTPGGRVTNEDVMRAVLRLTREFGTLRKAVTSR